MPNDLGHQQTRSQIYVHRSINVGIYDGSLCDMNEQIIELLKEAVSCLKTMAASSMVIAFMLYMLALSSCSKVH